MSISEASELPGISVLLCTFNGAPRIADTLACLAQQELPAGTGWEIIFVDNASTDGVAELAQNTWRDFGSPAPLRVFAEPRPGYKVAMQLAISKVRYPYACIVDDDNRLDTNYLRIGLDILRGNVRIGVLGGQNTPTFGGAEPAWFTGFRHCYAAGQPLDRVGGGFTPLSEGNVGRNVLWGAGMFVQTIIWRQLQAASFQSLFTGRQGEANLTAGEDDELCYVAQLLSYEVWYSSRLHLRHYMAASRLTEQYRNQLFYASARSATRLNAYRNALWGKPATIGQNLFKDTGYMVLSMLRALASRAFWQAIFQGNRIAWMNQRHTLSVICDVVTHSGQVKTYYQQVLQLRQNLQAAGPSH